MITFGQRTGFMERVSNSSQERQTIREMSFPVGDEKKMTQLFNVEQVD